MSVQICFYLYLHEQVQIYLEHNLNYTFIIILHHKKRSCFCTNSKGMDSSKSLKGEIFRLE